jgi:hypothetical protein
MKLTAILVVVVALAFFAFSSLCKADTLSESIKGYKQLTGADKPDSDGYFFKTFNVWCSTVGTNTCPNDDKETYNRPKDAKTDKAILFSSITHANDVITKESDRDKPVAGTSKPIEAKDGSGNMIDQLVLWRELYVRDCRGGGSGYNQKKIMKGNWIQGEIGGDGNSNACREKRRGYYIYVTTIVKTDETKVEWLPAIPERWEIRNH